MNYQPVAVWARRRVETNDKWRELVGRAVALQAHRSGDEDGPHVVDVTAITLCHDLVALGRCESTI